MGHTAQQAKLAKKARDNKAETNLQLFMIQDTMVALTNQNISILDENIFISIFHRKVKIICRGKKRKIGF